jgi:Mg2+-importing ATPase
MPTSGNLEEFWSLAPNELMAQLGAAPGGLTTAEAKRRLFHSGPNRLHTRKRIDVLILLLAQFKSPLILILLGAVILSFFLRETVDAAIIIAIVLLSSVLGFWQEKRATDAVRSLLAIVRIEARVVRDGVENRRARRRHSARRHLCAQRRRHCSG